LLAIHIILETKCEYTDCTTIIGVTIRIKSNVNVHKDEKGWSPGLHMRVKWEKVGVNGNGDRVMWTGIGMLSV